MSFSSMTHSRSPKNLIAKCFALTAVAALPRWEKSLLIVAGEASARVKDPSETKYMLPDVDLTFSGLPVPY